MGLQIGIRRWLVGLRIEELVEVRWVCHSGMGGVVLTIFSLIDKTVENMIKINENNKIEDKV